MGQPAKTPAQAYAKITGKWFKCETNKQEKSTEQSDQMKNLQSPT